MDLRDLHYPKWKKNLVLGILNSLRFAFGLWNMKDIWTYMNTSILHRLNLNSLGTLVCNAKSYTLPRMKSDEPVASNGSTESVFASPDFLFISSGVFTGNMNHPKWSTVYTPIKHNIYCVFCFLSKIVGTSQDLSLTIQPFQDFG